MAKDFFKSERGPKSVSGQTPEQLLVPTEPNVQPTQVSPEMSGVINQAKGTTVQVGPSNTAFGVSSGLVNALDVVQGVAGTMRGAVNTRDSYDKWRLSQYSDAVAQKKEEEEFKTKTEQEKLKDLRDIQKEYAPKMLSQAAQARLDLTAADSEIEIYNLDFQSKLARVNRLKAQLEASGSLSEDEIFNEISSRYEALKTEYAGNENRIMAIEMAQDTEAASWASDIATSAETAVGQFTASGKLETIFQKLPSNVGYDEFKKTMLHELAAANQDNELGQALINSYDENTDEFTGPYAGLLENRLSAVLKPEFDKAVEYQTAAAEGRVFTQIRNVSLNTAARTYNQGEDVVSSEVSEGLQTVFRLASGLTVSPTYEERSGIIENFGASLFHNWLQRNPSGNISGMSDLLDKTLIDNADEIFAFMDITDPEEQGIFLNGMLARIDSLVKEETNSTIARNLKGMSTEQQKTLDRNNAAFNAGFATTGGGFEAIKQSPVFRLIEDGEKIPFFSAPVNHPNADPDTAASIVAHNELQQQYVLTMGSEVLASALASKGMTAEQIFENLKTWGELVQTTYASDPNDPDAGVLPQNLNALPAYLGKHLEDSVFSVSFNPSSPGEFTIGRGETVTGNQITQARIGSALRLMNYDPETKKYNPGDGYDNNPFIRFFTSEATMLFRGYGEDNAYDFTPQAKEGFVSLVTQMSAILPQHLVGGVLQNNLVTALKADLGGDLPDHTSSSIRRAVDEVTKDPSQENYTLLFDKLRAAKAGQYGQVDKNAFVLNPDEALQRDPFAFLGATYMTDVTKGIPTWRSEYGDGGFISTTGSWIGYAFGGTGDYFQLSDSQAAEFGAMIARDPYTRNVIGDLALEVQGAPGESIFVTDEEDNFMLAPGLSEDTGDGQNARKKAAYDLNKAIHARGLSWEAKYNSDGEMIGLRLRPEPQSVSFDDKGNPVLQEAIPVDTSGTWEDFLTKHVDSEQEYKALRAKESLDFLAKEQGRQDVEKYYNDPNWRRSFISNWSLNASTLFTNPNESKQNRLAYANQIDDTYALFSNWDRDTEGQAEVRDFVTALRSNREIEIDPEDEDSIYGMAREWTINNGYNGETVSMFALNLAVLSKLTDNPMLMNSTPFDFTPEHLNEVSGDMSRGYRPTSFTLDNYLELGQDSSNIGPLPLFAPLNLNDGLMWDPRVFTRPIKVPPPAAPGTVFFTP